MEDKKNDLVLTADTNVNDADADLVVNAAVGFEENSSNEKKDRDDNGHHSHHHSPHHHHHHSHGHHSHRHHSRRHKKENKVISFIKKHRSALINTCIVFSIMVIVFCVIFWKEKDIAKDPYTSDYDKTTGYVQIETSVYSDDISIANNALTKYMNSKDLTVNSVYKEYRGYENRLDTAMPVRFSYDVTGIPEGVSVKSAELEVSETSSYTDPQKIKLDGKSDAVDIYLLKSGAKYYYRLNLTLTDGSQTGSCGSFKTEASPRFMNVSGAYNMRDIGGWTTVLGKKIKQGLLYRGTEIDGAVESKYCLTDEGIDQMKSVLKIKTDMDLRTKSETLDGKDVLGDDVDHTYYGVAMYEDIFKVENYESMRKVFSDLADESNYPVYTHCTYGRDRTGTVCYLLEALLGLSDDDLRREYELSAFNDSYVDLESFAGFTKTVELQLEGATTQEKVENYLLSVGVTADEIASIRRIFLGE